MKKHRYGGAFFYADTIVCVMRKNCFVANFIMKLITTPLTRTKNRKFGHL